MNKKFLWRLLQDLTDPRKRCVNCNGFTDTHILYCTSCGSQNPYFDESALLREYGKPLTLLREECRRGHLEEKAEAYTKDHETYKLSQRYPFCPICGERIAFVQ